VIPLLTVNLAFSSFVFWLAARLYLLPRLGELLMFLAPGAIYAGMPPQFAYPAALGDLLAALLALAAMLALLKGAAGSRLLLWTFNVEGSVDLIAAIALATIFGAPDYMGAAYWIPAFWVPALLVTHYVVFVLLFRMQRKAGVATPG